MIGVAPVSPGPFVLLCNDSLELTHQFIDNPLGEAHSSTTFLQVPSVMERVAGDLDSFHHNVRLIVPIHTHIYMLTGWGEQSNESIAEEP